LPLAGATLSGNVYAFTTPDEGVRRVRFFIDNPGMSGGAYRTENSSPYDLAGGSVSAANPFDTASLSDGAHTVTAAIELDAGGAEVVHATFVVANSVPSLAFNPDAVTLSLGADETTFVPVNLTTTTSNPAAYMLIENTPWLTVGPMTGTTPASLGVTLNTAGLTPGSYSTTIDANAPGFASDALTVTLSIASEGFDLLVSLSPIRSSPSLLEGATVSGNVYVFTSPETGVSRVRFFIDDPARNGSPYRTEKTAPHDLAGGSVTVADPFNTNALSNGVHGVTAEIQLSGGGTEVVTALFTVAN
jgi:hypothetical protein